MHHPFWGVGVAAEVARPCRPLEAAEGAAVGRPPWRQAWEEVAAGAAAVQHPWRQAWEGEEGVEAEPVALPQALVAEAGAAEAARPPSLPSSQAAAWEGEAGAGALRPWRPCQAPWQQSNQEAAWAVVAAAAVVRLRRQCSREAGVEAAEGEEGRHPHAAWRRAVGSPAAG